MLEKTTCIMNIDEPIEGIVWFNTKDECPPYDALREMWITVDDWHDLGNPRVLTVTIQPGDRLNGADDA